MDEFFRILSLFQGSVLCTAIPFVIKFLMQKFTERKAFKQRELELTTIGIPCSFDLDQLPIQSIPIVNDWKASHYVEGNYCLIRYKRLSFALRHCDYVFYPNGDDIKMIDLKTLIRIVTGQGK